MNKHLRGESVPGLLSAEAFGHSQGAECGMGLTLGEIPFQVRARSLVFEYVMNRLDKSDTAHETFSPEDVYVVWFSKTLQNWKALISTTLPDGMYYEVTYNGDKHETYLDVYKKFENVCIPDEE